MNNPNSGWPQPDQPGQFGNPGNPGQPPGQPGQPQPGHGGRPAPQPGYGPGQYAPGNIPSPGQPAQPYPPQQPGQPGWGQSGYGPQGYAPQPYAQPFGGPGQPPVQRRPSAALAYVAVALYLACAALSFTAAIISWDGTTDNIHMLATTIGIAFSDDITGNVDFAITTTMIVASVVTVLAVVLAFRIGFVRWLLAIISLAVVTGYVFAIVDLLSSGMPGETAKYVTVPSIAGVAWLLAMVLVLLPPVGRAMRGKQRPPAQPGYQAG